MEQIVVNGNQELHILYEEGLIHVSLNPEEGPKASSGECVAVVSKVLEGTGHAEALEVIVEKNGGHYSGITRRAVDAYWCQANFPEAETVIHEKPRFLQRVFGRKKTSKVTPVIERPDFRMVAVLFMTKDCDHDDATQFLNSVNFSNNSGIFCLFVGIGDGPFSILRIVGGRYPNCEFIPISEYPTTGLTDAMGKAPGKLYNWIQKEKVAA